MVNHVSASSGISSPQQAVNFISKRSFRWRFMEKFLLFPIVSLFSGFQHDFIRCVDFTRIAASNTASDDVTN